MISSNDELNRKSSSIIYHLQEVLDTSIIYDFKERFGTLRDGREFTGELVGGSFDCSQTTTAIRTATFTKSAAASRLRITIREYGERDWSGFLLFVSQYEN